MSMRIIRTGLYPTLRLESGATILAAAERVDTTLVNTRLTAFATTHQAYIDSQRAVEAVERVGLASQRSLYRLDAEQDEAVEAIARVLVTEKHPRTNPFAAFRADTPTEIKDLQFGDKALAIHTLAETLQADPDASEATKHAAQAARAVAEQMLHDLVPFEKLQADLRVARAARDAAGRAWDAALTALKRGTRAAADEGAPHLHSAVFGHLKRAKPKAETAESTATAAAPASDKPAAPEVQ